MSFSFIENPTAKTDDHGAPESVPADTFFDFFDPPVVEEGDDISATLAADFEVGFSIKEKLIPRALLYFTGDIFNEDDDSETSDSEDEDESEGDAVILTVSRSSDKSKSSISK